jgi:hypothetical protein
MNRGQEIAEICALTNGAGASSHLIGQACRFNLAGEYAHARAADTASAAGPAAPETTQNGSHSSGASD